MKPLVQSIYEVQMLVCPQNEDLCYDLYQIVMERCGRYGFRLYPAHYHQQLRTDHFKINTYSQAQSIVEIVKPGAKLSGVDPNGARALLRST